MVMALTYSHATPCARVGEDTSIRGKHTIRWRGRKTQMWIETRAVECTHQRPGGKNEESHLFLELFFFVPNRMYIASVCMNYWIRDFVDLS